MYFSVTLTTIHFNIGIIYLKAYNIIINFFRTFEFIYYKMEVDSEEVKRHLDILGYTQIEPSLLNEFVKGKYWQIISSSELFTIKSFIVCLNVSIH